MASRRKSKKIKLAGGGIDRVFLLLALGLTLFGLVMIYDTSVVIAFETWGDRLWFFKNQTLWLGIGLVAMLAASRIDYHWWQKSARPLLYLNIILLVLVLLPGFSSETMGARRRLIIPVALPFLSHVNFQPSELAKLTSVLFLSSWLGGGTDPKKKLAGQKGFKPRAGGRISRLSKLLAFIAIIGGLIMLEPDLGTTLIVSAVSVLVFFLGGAPISDMILLAVLLPSFALTFALSSAYRKDRLLAFLSPGSDQLGISYHLNQLLIALGSGGLFGLGLGQSRQKYQYLPEPATDSIFAVLGEELGFVGAALLLAALFGLIWRGFNLAEQAPDRFGWLLGMGLVSLIAIQTIVNLGSVTGLLPITGVPLPFISYGGSSLTILLIGVGILLNISKAR